jgi:methionine sulfoxide reductase heme-binding subunit
MSDFLHSTALWYLVRGSGIVSLILLTGVVALGVATTRRWQAPGVPRFVTAAVHRSVALLAVVFLGIHVLTSVVDSYVSIRIVDALVPFVGKVHPVALGLGAVAFDFVVALVLTSLLRARLGFRAWRIVHWFAYLAWPVALAHGLLMGADAGAPWNVIVVGTCVLTVGAALAWRLQAPKTAPMGGLV